MTVRECYEKIGGDYDEVVSRFPNESLILKFTKKFLYDPSFKELTTALNNEDYETAFRAVHTLKGVCLNLGLGILYESSHQMTEALRAKKIEVALGLQEKVTKDYLLTIEAIEGIDE